jgi:hypothetical protein
MLSRWSLLTGCGCLVDRQLLGSALAGWPSYVWSLLLGVGLTTAAAAWQELCMRGRFSDSWAKQPGISAEAAKIDERTITEARQPSPAAAAHPSSSGKAAASGSADRGRHGTSSVDVLASGISHGSASKAAAAAAAHAGSVSSGACQALGALLASNSRSAQEGDQGGSGCCGLVPCPEVLYSTTAAGRRVTISVKVGRVAKLWVWCVDATWWLGCGRNCPAVATAQQL